MVGAPPQLLTTLGDAAMTTPAGNVSVKVSPVRAGEAAGLVTVKVSVALCPTPRVATLNAFVRDGSACTVRVEFVTLLVMRAVAPMLAAALVYAPTTRE